MAGNPLHKPVIPRRSRSCCRTKKKFDAGDDYISLILEGDGDGTYTRDDILLAHWNANQEPELLEQACSSWKAKIPAGTETVKEPEELIDRAFELFYEALDKADALRAFVLALFLARKKALLFRQELVDGERVAYVYEVAETEEALCVDVIKPSQQQIEEIQDELSREIGLLS